MTDPAATAGSRRASAGESARAGRRARVPRLKPPHPFYVVSRSCVRTLLSLFFPLRVRGLEHLPPGTPYLLVSNHASVLDPLVVGSACPRQIAYLAKSSLFQPPFGLLLRGVGAVPVERERLDRRALETAVGLLTAGRPLLLFPEGTRAPPRRLLPFKRGFLLIARRARVPVLPVAVLGTAEAWPSGSRWPRPRPVEVRFGAPIPPTALERVGADGVRAAVQGLLAGRRL